MNREEMIAELKSITKDYIWIDESTGYGSGGELCLFGSDGCFLLGSIDGGGDLRFVGQYDLNASKDLENLYPYLYTKHIEGEEIDWEEDDCLEIDDALYFYYLVKIREDNPQIGECYFGNYDTECKFYVVRRDSVSSSTDFLPWEKLIDEELQYWIKVYAAVQTGIISCYDDLFGYSTHRPCRYEFIEESEKLT